ncbi:MAG: class I SAM-dependent methyltransferase [Deltaproteobacteria bacterium]|nr:class I SAM-dependent methyltransferase [Deltaproteobacteria bacterium]
MRILRPITLAAALVMLGGAGCALPGAASHGRRAATDAAPSAELRAIVDAPDRSADDRALDGGRHPAELLAFIGAGPGMRIAELGAGGGYTTELLARAVGPTGTVYGQNSRFILERFAEKPWSARLAKPVTRNVVRVDRPFDDPLPPEVHDLDAVVMVLFYHDTVWMGVDRDAMSRAVFRALKPGGTFVIVDHSGTPGSDARETQTLHRIEEHVVRDEVSRAGFRLAREAAFLRNPEDTRDWSASPSAAGARRGTTDRFVLAFVKP